MKTKFLTWILSIVISLPVMAVTACGGGDDDEPSVPVSAVSISVSSKTLDCGSDAGQIGLTVKGNADWAIRTDADWVTLYPSGGVKDAATQVQVKVTANTGMDVRQATLSIVSGGKAVETVTVVQQCNAKATPSLTSLSMGAQESSATLTINANGNWTLTGAPAWLAVTPANGGKGDTAVTLKAQANSTSQSRSATLTLACGKTNTEIKVTQLSDVINAPAGYTLVWSDEFNEGTKPSADWVLENWAAGHVNNELQTYTSKTVDGKETVEIKDGFLHINCFKGTDGKIYSGRMNARPSTGWLYGYVEARIMLPKGKGTWPAFWMMPSNVDWNTNGWPRCGEIDIMEEVGANPDYVSSSLHTQKYNHMIGTQKTHEMKCAGAEGEFHVYALEWTADAITTYVDGKVQLRATRAEMGTDHDSWPFHYAFYPILNLAWGGDWGGYKGIDESALPVTMKVDYVRIFQK